MTLKQAFELIRRDSYIVIKNINEKPNDIYLLENALTIKERKLINGVIPDSFIGTEGTTPQIRKRTMLCQFNLSKYIFNFELN